MIKNLVIALILIILFGCNPNKLKGLADFKELKDSGLVMQVMKLKDQQQNTSVIKYGVRIFPGRKAMEEMNEETRNALWYKTDSLFYLQSGTEKYYADMIEPIANGQKNNFEYLLMFEIVPGMKLTDLSVAFNDKYITQKIHHLQLNAQ